MKRTTTITLILFLSALISCSLLDNNSHASKIIGQWQWVRSSGGFAGEVTTRDSAGVPDRHFNFKSNGAFTFYRTDTLVQAGKYSLQKKEGDVIISYDTGQKDFFFDQRVTFKGKDTLILSDECYDCYIHTYIRAQ
ncbi:hypothetical protein [Fodinibius salsisoli]|uniref:Lipocalin-like domain-containing protein n=1 Tax=Fodinibius salsisoli TaxID=2820877 RepID=A0ABT3PKQ8_9BACT|nr:hypothetical protein [Fodinibius salsisoli]MCW9706435.1 hypothetical protein [Fodinibius salsisoli]